MYHPSARTVSPRSSSRRTPPSRRRASPLIQRTRCAFGPTGSTTSTCRRGPTRCGRTRRPARLETAAARGCGRVVLRRRLGAPRRRVPRTPREAPATGAGARRRPRGTVGRRRVSECVCAFDARSEFVQKGRGRNLIGPRRSWGPLVIRERRARATRSNRRGESGPLSVPRLTSSSLAVRDSTWGEVRVTSSLEMP